MSITTFPSVVHMLADTAARHPGHEALVAGDLRLGYAEYARCVAGLAQEIRRHGGQGARVALLCANSAEAAIASFAIAAAGAVFCPMNPAYTARELGYALEDAGCALALCDAGAAQTLAGLALPVAVMQIGGQAPEWRARWGADAALVLDGLLPDAAALGMIQYTGGTTGRAKGVMLTHAAIAANVAQREALLPTETGDRFLCIMPLFHSFALSMNLYQAAYCGGALVILPRYRPDWVVAAIGAERITVFSAGPTVFIGLLQFDAFRAMPQGTLRRCYSGAAALPVEIMRRWRELTGCEIYEGYGQTEAGPILTYNSPLFPVIAGTVGKPLPDTEVQIVDVGTGTRVQPPGTPGEIRARGPQIMLGYWGKEAETREALRGGWLHTGDIGVIGADGHLAIRDRKKDMIVSSGYNIYPREVEEVLLMDPRIREAAVIGLPDDYRGERVVAHIAADGITEAEILAHCRSNLAAYKVPVLLRLMAEIPKTPVGKIDKKAVLARELAGQAAGA